MTRKKISIISPCFNEADNVERCHQTVRALFDGPLADYDLEHIFADNASTDGTPEILRGIAAGDPAVKVILNARNFGPFRSMFNALRSATGDAVLVFLAVDLQDPPEKIVDFVRIWETGVEVVAGARVNRQESLALRVCRGIFYQIVNRLSDIDIPVNVGEFQLIDRKVWRAVVPASHRGWCTLRGGRGARRRDPGRFVSWPHGRRTGRGGSTQFTTQCGRCDAPSSRPAAVSPPRAAPAGSASHAEHGFG